MWRGMGAAVLVETAQMHLFFEVQQPVCTQITGKYLRDAPIAMPLAAAQSPDNGPSSITRLSIPHHTPFTALTPSLALPHPRTHSQD